MTHTAASVIDSDGGRDGTRGHARSSICTGVIDGHLAHHAASVSWLASHPKILRGREERGADREVSGKILARIFEGDRV